MNEQNNAVNSQQELTSHEKQELKRKEKELHQKRLSEAQQAHDRQKGLLAKALLVLGVLAGLGVAYFVFNNWLVPQPPANLLDYNLGSHQNAQFHIHQELEIEILGVQQVIPADVGISPGFMHVLHTHEEDNKIHVETPYAATLRLKDFFTIWKQAFNKTCIFDNCVDETHVLEFFVNGQASSEFENLELKDGQEIKIVYREK